MFITLVVTDATHDLALTFEPEATVRDLLAATAPTRADSEGAVVDGRQVDLDTPLPACGLRNGSVVAIGPPEPARPSRPLSLVTVGGLVAGQRWALRAGRSVVGRGEDADVRLEHATVSRRHAAFTATGANDVAVVDLGSRNGTWLQGEHLADARPVALGSVLRLGAVLASPRAERRDDASTAAVRDGDGTIPVHRPLRAVSLARDEPDGLVPPVEPTHHDVSSTFSAATVFATLLMAGLMALLVRNPAFAALALIAPMAMVGTALEQRRRVRRRDRAARREYERGLATYEANLDQRVRDEVAWRWGAWPDLAETVRRVTLPSVHLWERRTGHDDFLVLRIGVGPRDLPIAVDLRDGGVIGIAGDRDVALAVARALVCQAVVHHGPADLCITPACDAARRCEWDWLKWLPHLDATGDQGATVLAVVDGDALPERATAAIVVAPTRHQLPPACTALVEALGADGEATYRDLRSGEAVDRVLADGCTRDVAMNCARLLARFRDPEAAGAGLQDHLELLDVSSARPTWGDDRDPSLAASIGMGRDGPFTVDLVGDGPHALIAGTTGAGKSELLRSLVVGLATNVAPEHLTFALIDFKGGSAFDACARLPHTVGVVTDLDAPLAARALRCFEAELRYRERVLRAVGAPDLTAYRRAGHPFLPRLVIVVDEFATLKAELPDFVDALIGVAQRGRSLGLHLVLATQRPSGTVSDHVRANANLRIALRVQDRSDSVDVVGTGDAADLPAHCPGRAVVRIGHGEHAVVQFATSSAPVAPEARDRVRVEPFSLETVAGPPQRRWDGPTQLEQVVDAIVVEHTARGGTPPRRPWPEPLPRTFDLSSLGDDEHPRWFVAFALADDPDNQCQHPFGWQLDAGNLALFGIRGSGTTTALRSIVESVAQRHSSEEVHVYVISLGSGDLRPLEALPHVGAVIGPNEDERRDRLLRRVERTIQDRRARRATDHTTPRVLIAVDGFEASPDDPLGRIISDGGEVGVHVVIAADRTGALPLALAGRVPERLLFRLADPHDYAMAGLRAAEVPSMNPGRAVDVSTGKVVQVALPSRVVSNPCGRGAPSVDALPTAVRVDALPIASIDARPWMVPIGLEADDLAVASVTVHRDEHVLVTGPPRSGRTNALRTFASVVRVADPDTRVITISPSHRRALHDAVIEASASRRALLVVDDADRVDDPTGAMTELLTTGATGGDVVVVAAVNATSARTMYQHWTRLLRRSRLALLLGPDADRDGELAGRALPRRFLVAPAPGRGWLLQADDLTAVQVALDTT